MMFSARVAMSAVALSLMSAASVRAQVASYFFQDSFGSAVPGAPALIPIDPLGANGFATESVFGTLRRVYHMDGNNFPVNQQAGLFLDASALVDSDDYSVELVFAFFERNAAWRMILDAHDRKSDVGFYASPSNHLNVYPTVDGTGAGIFSGAYHHVMLTVQHRQGQSAMVRAYLDGVKQLEAATDNMNLVNADNPGKLIHLIADNTQAGGQGEFSDASIALFRLYRGALADATVAALALDPFGAAPCPCDLNHDGLVADDDFVIFINAYNILDCADPAMPGGCPADFNHDGAVEDSDFVIFVAAYNALLCP